MRVEITGSGVFTSYSLEYEKNYKKMARNSRTTDGF